MIGTMKTKNGFKWFKNLKRPFVLNSSHRLLILTRYDKMGASSRIRFFEFEDRLKSSGYHVDYQVLLSDDYLKKLYQSGRRSYLQLLFLYLRRLFFLLFNTRKYDLFWVEKELFPGLPVWLDQWFLKKMSPLVLDYDDAVHLNYKNGKIETLMGGAQVVFAGSPYLKEVAELSGAQSVVRIPTAVEPQKNEKIKSKPLCVGWIGSPASEPYLIELFDEIKADEDSEDFRFLFVGVQDPIWKKLKNVTCVEWSPDNEKKCLAEIDVGMMPLRDTNWEKGKCSYKILLYNSWRIPALASAVGMNCEVVQDGVNGYLVESDWNHVLRKVSLMEQSEFQKMGEAAHQKVVENYSYEKVFSKIHEQFQNLMGSF